MAKCRVAGKSLKHSAAVHTALVLVIYLVWQMSTNIGTGTAL